MGLPDYTVLPNHRYRLKPFWYLVACYNYLTLRKTVQHDLILTCSTTLLFVSGRRWKTFTNHLVTTRFTRTAVEILMTKTSFLIKQNIQFMILQHISQSTSAVNGSCWFKQLRLSPLQVVKCWTLQLKMSIVNDTSTIFLNCSRYILG